MSFRASRPSLPASSRWCSDFEPTSGSTFTLHSLATDGAFLDVGGGSVRWLAAPPLSDADLQRVLAGLHRDLATGDDRADEGDDDGIDPALAGCLSLSLGGPPPRATATAPPLPAPLTATAFGMSLHAATAVDGRDRPRLERLCRFLLRPPFAHDAVERLSEGRVRVHFKRPTRAGATHADMSTDRFLAQGVVAYDESQLLAAHRAGDFDGLEPETEDLVDEAADSALVRIVEYEPEVNPEEPLQAIDPEDSNAIVSATGGRAAPLAPPLDALMDSPDPQEAIFYHTLCVSHEVQTVDSGHPNSQGITEDYWTNADAGTTVHLGELV